MKRRDFLRSAGMVSAGLAFPEAAKRLFAADASAGGWRTFELTTRVELLQPSGMTRIWLPAALISRTPFQKTLANTFHAEGGSAKMTESKADALGIVFAEFPAGAKPVLTLTSRIATKNIAVDVSSTGGWGGRKSCGAATFSPPDTPFADRWNRERDGGPNHGGGENGRR